MMNTVKPYDNIILGVNANLKQRFGNHSGINSLHLSKGWVVSDIRKYLNLLRFVKNMFK